MEWRRRLEHERLSQLAMPASDSRFAGPGAAAAETDDEDEAEGAEEMGGMDETGAAGAGGEGSAAQAAKAAMAAAAKITLLITRRVSHWANAFATWWLLPLTLLTICGDKIINDGQIRDLAATIAASYKASGGQVGGAGVPKIKVPKLPLLGDPAQKILDNAPIALTLEWFILLLLMVLVYSLIGCVVVFLCLGCYCYLNPVECGMAGAKDLLIR